MPFYHPNYLLISQAAAAAFAVARLLQLGLARRFSFLCGYLLVVAVTSSLLGVVPEHSRLYLLTFLFAEPVAWCAAALAVFEMFALVFHDYPGVRTGGRWALNAALAASVAVSLFFAAKLPEGGSLTSRRLYYELVFDRSIHFSLTVIIIILMWCLSRYRLDLDRNTYVASVFFSVMFLAEAAAKLIDSVSPHLFARYVDYPEVGFAAVCFAGWGGMIRPPSARPLVRKPLNKARETELLQQLDTLNDILLRSGRR